jgi:hypothetical protein
MAAVFSQSDIDIMCKAIDIADGHLAKRGYCNFLARSSHPASSHALRPESAIQPGWRKRR